MRKATSVLLHVSTVMVVALQGVSAQAQDVFPTKPVRIILSSGPGGAQDVMARLMAERLAPLWKQNVIVENRTGGGAVIATEAIARATPDGHTLGLLGSTLATNPAVRSDLRYDTNRDLTALLHAGSAPAVLTVRAEFPARTPSEFVAVVKATPGKFAYASPGTSTNGHRAMEALKRATGIDVTHVPYKGGAPAMIDLLAGQVAMLMASPTAFGPHIRAGRLEGDRRVQRPAFSDHARRAHARGISRARLRSCRVVAVRRAGTPAGGD